LTALLAQSKQELLLQFTRVVEKWLCSFSKTDMETREEETFSIKMFERFLGQQSHVSRPLLIFRREHWENS
jgi:hypothetical protein